VRRYLPSDNTMQPLIHRGQVKAFLEDEQTFSLGSLLTVLTTKIRSSKPRVREEYTTSFMHIFYTNKVPQVVLQFLWTGTHLGEKRNKRATQAMNSRTSSHDRPFRGGRPGRCGWPCQVQSHLPRATSSVPITSFPACTTWMNKIDQGNVDLIEWMKL
jgi:hypothetical protein